MTRMPCGLSSTMPLLHGHTVCSRLFSQNGFRIFAGLLSSGLSRSAVNSAAEPRHVERSKFVQDFVADVLIVRCKSP